MNGPVSWGQVSTITAAVDTVAPAVPTGLTATGAFETIWLTWDENTEADFSHYEIAEKTTTTPPANQGGSVDYVTRSNSQVVADLADGTTKNFFIRAVDTSGNMSDWTTIASATTTSQTDFTVTNTQINGIVNATSFAAGLEPIEVVSSLPTTGNFEGRTAVLTTDGKLYRYHSGAWTSSVPAVDVTGQLTSDQIATLEATKIAGQLTDAQLADIASTKITGQLSDSQLADIASTKITGQLTSAQIASLEATKVSGQLTDSQLADISAAKVTGQLIADQIGNGVSLKDQAVFTFDDDMAHTLRIDQGTITYDAVNKYSGTHSALITYTGSLDPDPTGDTNSLAIVIEDYIALRFAGKRIRIRGFAKQPDTNAATEFGIAYSTSDNGNSGWAKFTPTTSWQVFELFYDVPAPVSGGSDYLGFWADTSNTGKATLFDQWYIEVVEDLPNINGQISETQIEDDAISTPKIQANAVTAASIAANAIVTDKIAAGSVLADKIATDAVTADKILASSITTSKLAAGAVTAATIAVGTITSAEIASGTITAAQMAAGTITSNEIASGSILADKIAADAVTAAAIQSGAITTAKLAAGAVTANEIAANSILAGNISAGAITTAKLAAGAVTANEIAANSITATQLSAGTITSNEIAAGTILASNISSGTITATQMAAGTITANEIASNAITAAHINAGAVGADQIAANAIVASKVGIGDFQNLFFDENQTDLGYMESDIAGTTQSFVSSSVAETGSYRRIENAAGVAAIVITKSSFLVNPNGEELRYYIEVDLQDGKTGDARIQIKCFTEADGTGTTAIVSGPDYSSTSHGVQEGTLVIPAGYKSAKIRLQKRSTGDAERVNFGKVIVRRMNAGELIVDGGIVADHIGTNEVIANAANIKDATITDAKIADLSAAKLNAGTAIAGSITVDGTALEDVRDNSTYREKFRSMGALAPMVAWVAGSVNYATIEPDTIIYKNGEIEVDATTATAGTFTVASGDLIESNKPVSVAQSRDLLVSLAASGKVFMDRWTRSDDYTVYAYAINADASVKVSASGESDKTQTVPAGSLVAISTGWIYSSNKDVTITSTADVAIARSAGDGSDAMCIWPVSREVLGRRSNTLTYSGTASATAASGSGQIYYVDFGIDGLGMTMGVGDGAGSEVEIGVPVDALASNYVFPHAVADYAVAAIEPVTINVYDNTGTLQATHDLTAASKTNPLAVEVGNQNGTDPELYSAGAYMIGDAPFYLRTNNPSGDYEYSMRGWRDDLRSAYQASSMGSASQNVARWASDPATRVNAGTTAIDPGKITVSGSTTLADWRMGGDETKIDGGSISAESISSNSLKIGNRNIVIQSIKFEANSPSTDQISWDNGNIRYGTDSGTTVVAVAAGSATFTGSRLYIYWAKDASTLTATTDATTAFADNNVVIASYYGDTNLNSTIGTTVVDGDHIKTGTIEATHIKTGTITADRLVIDGNVLESDGSGNLTITNDGITRSLVSDGAVDLPPRNWAIQKESLFS